MINDYLWCGFRQHIDQNVQLKNQGRSSFIIEYNIQKTLTKNTLKGEFVEGEDEILAPTPSFQFFYSFLKATWWNFREFFYQRNTKKISKQKGCNVTQPPTAKVGVARGRCDLDLKTKPSTTTEKSSKLTGGRLKPAGRYFPTNA